MALLILMALVIAAYFVLARRQVKKHHALIGTIKTRVHVNGIRGKSSVTRLIAAALREGELSVLAKTTGTAARIITDHTVEAPVVRKEPDIAEQRKVLHQHIPDGNYDAVVFECMAINPIYQRYLESKIMQSTIGVITNIREDHTDALGKTLPEIARSLSATIPTNGHLVTAETDEELLGILADECQKRGTKLHAVGNMRIAAKHIAKFGHFEYKENVAIAIMVARLLKIKRRTALAGMYKALPDPGAFVLKEVAAAKESKLQWANLFAINDRESFVLTVDSLHKQAGESTKKAVILNNRHDRPERVSQFVDICLRQVKADYIFTFGDYETQVVTEVKKAGATNVKVVRLGNATNFKDASGDVLLGEIVTELDGSDAILYGAVNIHTPQAQAILKVLEA